MFRNSLRVITAILVLVCLPRTGIAQVMVNLAITPPYSPYYSDYTGLNGNKSIVTLYSQSARQVYLTGSIRNADNSLVIQLKEDYKPPVPIQLQANAPLTLTGSQLNNIFGSGSTGDLLLTGITTQEIAINQALPEGNYTICFTCRDFATGQVVGESCRSITVQYVEPPQFISPLDNADVMAINPQFVNVMWTPVTPYVPGVTYRLKIVKLLPGISPSDAIANNTMVLLDKGNLMQTTYPLNTASGVVLDTGRIYVMQVTASSPKVYFKNGGKSDLVTFVYRNPAGVSGSNVSFAFVIPNSKMNVLEVNNEKPLQLSWTWYEKQTSATANVNKVSELLYTKYGVVKYMIKIGPPNLKMLTGKIDKNFKFQKQIGILPGDTILRSLLKLSSAEAANAGFKDSCWYTATVSALDKNGMAVQTASSVNFQYRRIKDQEPMQLTTVKAAINYEFEGQQGNYKAVNAQVIIQALQKVSNYLAGYSIVMVNNQKYLKLGEAADTTDANGMLNVDVKVPIKNLPKDSIYYRVVIAGKYYLDNWFPLLKIRAKERDTLVNFGQLTAQTYAYSLKLYVKKLYTAYSVNEKDGKLNISLSQMENLADEGGFYYDVNAQTMVYVTDTARVAAGIPVVIYRKDKKSYIPPVEGDISDYNHKSGFTEVARGVTQQEKDAKGRDVTFVKFEKLLSCIMDGDEYYIIALNGKNYPKTSLSVGSSANVVNAVSNVSLQNTQVQGTKSSSGQVTLQQPAQQTVQAGAGASMQYLNPYGDVMLEDGFVCSEKPLKIPKPQGGNPADSLYRQITASYEIISTKPPTSLVKGRLLYKWKSDQSGQLRPLANERYRIVIDYMVNDKSIGSIMSGKGTTVSQKFFIPKDADDLSESVGLIDFNRTMATGKTDAEGNFIADVVNLNQKGDLGEGYIGEKTFDFGEDKTYIPSGGNLLEQMKNGIINPVVNPWDGTAGGYNAPFGSQSQGLAGSSMQNGLNGGANIVFDAGMGAYEVGGGAIPGGAKMNFNMNTGSGPAGMTVPAPPEEPELIKFKRVYRIVPENQYIYPSMDTFAVQAFQVREISKPQTCLVKEVKLKITTLNEVNSLRNGMLVTVFRNLDDKTNDLPMGEGDGKYVQQTLVNAQYKGTAANLGNISDLGSGSQLFTTKFEYLWPSKIVSNDATAEFKTLLAGYRDYYAEACSDPTQGNLFYEPAFISINTAIDDSDRDLWTGDKQPPEIAYPVKLNPLISRALLRTIDFSSKLPLAFTKVMISGSAANVANSNTYNWTDTSGYVEFKAGQPPMQGFMTKDAGNNLYFLAKATGYKNSGVLNATLDKYGSQYVNTIPMEPSSKLSGHLVSIDNTTKGVPSYIKIGDANAFSTDSSGYFKDIPLPAIAGTKIAIIPKDLAYFDTAYIVKSTDVSKPSLDLGTFYIYKRKHRILFQVMSADDNKPIYNSTVQLADSVKTATLGFASFKFENVSVNNYTFVVRGPQGSNYIPVTKNVYNEESKDTKLVKVYLEKGSEISGTVKLDGLPVKHAKVYIDASQQTPPKPINSQAWGSITADAGLVTAYTDAAGNFVLNGVPVNNMKIDVLATLDTTFTVNGDRQKADIQNRTATVNFSLTSYKGMFINNLYGFPLTIEKITPQADPGHVKVTGVVQWSKALSHFELNGVNQVLRVQDVMFKAVDINGRKVGVAENTAIPVDGSTSLKLSYLDKYNVILKTVPQGQMQPMQPSVLMIYRDDKGYGAFKGKIHIVDNSFNYPSTYLSFSNKDNFFFAEKTSSNQINNVLSAVSSAMTEVESNSAKYSNNNLYLQDIQASMLNFGSKPAKFYLSDSAGKDIALKLLEFDATADPLNSFIDNDGLIHLRVNLDCHITNSKPENFKVQLQDLVLDNNELKPATSLSPIVLKLEDWTLEVKNWKFSAQEGGITSSNGLIRTESIDIPFSKFVLRHDMFLINDWKLSELKMGGGLVGVHVQNIQNAGLVYDLKTGIHMDAHWRFCITGTEAQPAAVLDKLPDLNNIIKLNYLQILSNNEKIFQLQQVAQPDFVKNNQLAKFRPQALFNGPNYFKVIGALDVGAPRLGDIALSLNYSKIGGQLTMTPENVKADFEGKGFVHFTATDAGNNANNITITPQQVTISGEVAEKPGESFNPMESTFYAANNSSPVYKVVVKPGIVTQLNNKKSEPVAANGYNLTIKQGGMIVGPDKDWSILTYEGVMRSNSTKADKGMDTTTMKFSVMGDISANSGGLSVTNVSTPFGSMSTIFDFANKRLMGKLMAKNVPVSTSTIDGTIETMFDPGGFYVGGGAKAKIKGVNPYVDGTYNLGFMIGSHKVEPSLWQTVNAYKDPTVVNNCYLSINQQQLKGFYFTLDRVIIDLDRSFDFVIVSGYVGAKVLFGADVWANFAPQGFNMGLGAHVAGRAAAGLAAITGTGITGFSTLNSSLDFMYQTTEPHFNMQATMDMGFGASVHQSLGFTSIDVSKQVNCSAYFSNNGCDFSLSSGPPQPTACFGNNTSH